MLVIGFQCEADCFQVVRGDAAPRKGSEPSNSSPYLAGRPLGRLTSVYASGALRDVLGTHVATPFLTYYAKYEGAFGVGFMDFER